MIQRIHQHPMHRLLFIGAISLGSIIVLIAGWLVIHSPMVAYAATTVSTTCVSTKGMQPALCERQDPIVQGCVTDAQTLDIETFFQPDHPTKPLGDVELRYSSTCKTYWIRTTAFITTSGVFKAIHAILIFHDQTKEDIVGDHIVVNTLTPYTAWTDMTTAPILAHAGAGSFELIGQPQPIIMPVTPPAPCGNAS